MTDKNQGFGYPIGAGWLPKGRVAVPDQSLPRKRHMGFGPSALVIALIIYLLIEAFADARAFSGNAGPLHFIWSFATVGFAIDEYRNFCWRARRLHDLGLSSQQIITKRWPVWLLLAFFFALFFIPIIGLPVPEGLEVSNSLVVALIIGAPIMIVGIGAISSHLYFRRVLRPFNEYLCTTPGEPGPNKYGPAPTD